MPKMLQNRKEHPFVEIFNNVSFSDLNASEDVEDKEFELITTAKQTDSRYGDFSYTKEDLESMAKHFNEDVLGREIPADDNHERNHRALAWIKPQSMRVGKSKKLDNQYSIYARLYRYTPQGKEFISTGVYRYFSLQIRPVMEKFFNNTKRVLKNVIVGLAFTNTPVIKDMAPAFSENSHLFNNSNNMNTFQILLTELSEKKVVSKQEKNLLQKTFISLSEEEKEEVKDQVDSVQEKPEQTAEEIEAAKKAEAEAEAAKKEAEEAKKEAEKALSESDKRYAEQQETIKMQGDEIKGLKEKALSEEVDKLVSEVSLSETNPIGFVSEKTSEVKEFAKELSESQRNTFFSLVKQIKNVDLSEKGSSATEVSDDAKEAQAKTYAAKLMEKDKNLAEHDALSQAYIDLKMV
jgi:hypothetical protein